MQRKLRVSLPEPHVLTLQSALPKATGYLLYHTQQRKSRESQEAEKVAVFEAKMMTGPEVGRQTKEQT